MKKLYKISQDQNEDDNTYDSAVVCAESQEEARRIHPAEGVLPLGDNYDYLGQWSDWVSYARLVQCDYLGIADESIPVGVVCASFNAG